MSNRPPISWSTALRELKADRLVRQPIREERLRTAHGGLRGSPAVALSGWRAASGRRYVVSIRPLSDFDASDAHDAVILFVSRDAEGIASIVLGGSGAFGASTTDLAAHAKAAGATEVHLHRLAAVTEFKQILDDLNAPAMEVA